MATQNNLNAMVEVNPAEAELIAEGLKMLQERAGIPPFTRATLTALEHDFRLVAYQPRLRGRLKKRFTVREREKRLDME